MVHTVVAVAARIRYPCRTVHMRDALTVVQPHDDHSVTLEPVVRSDDENSAGNRNCWVTVGNPEQKICFSSERAIDSFALTPLSH